MDRVLQWTEDLKTENDIIDSQHKLLFDLVRDINHAFNSKAPFKVIDTMFSILISYTFEHFELEESLMPERKNKLEHCYEHYQLIRSLHSYLQAFRRSKVPDVEPGVFLTNWLFTHISSYDIPVLQDLSQESLEAIETLQLEHDDTSSAHKGYDRDLSDLRAFKRLSSGHVSDEKITGHCYNASKLKNSTVSIENLSSGGLNITDTHIAHEIDDLVVIACIIGKNFRMKEKLIVKNRHGDSYGLEFFSPSQQTKEFLVQLYGSVRMGTT